MSPRQIRLLRELLEHDKVFVRDLRKSIGALNPAQITFSLRRQGWNIQTDFIAVQDRDGVICHPGYYWLDNKEKEKVRDFLKKTNGEVRASPLVQNSLEGSAPQTSEHNYSIRSEI